ncbi:hypothetical protein LXL04_029769 [Taraxacum kok-saghyz]
MLAATLDGNKTCRHFHLPEVLAATNNFNESLVIRRGGFGKVYMGNVINGSSVVLAAIKRLDSTSSQGASEFWAEVETLSKLRHCHLVSLFDHLHKLNTPLSWLQRLKICIGAARGLDYLHTGTGIDVGVTHRDVKSSNILLHNNWAAKISDFGLSKVGPTNQPVTYVNTLCQRKPALDWSLAEEQQNLARWATESIKEGNLKHIIDPGIRGEISPKCLKKFVGVAERCLHNNPKQRPTMAEVVVSLESALTIQEKTNKSLQDAGKTIFGKMLDMFIFPSNGDNPEKCLHNQHPNMDEVTVNVGSVLSLRSMQIQVPMGINNHVTDALLKVRSLCLHKERIIMVINSGFQCILQLLMKCNVSGSNNMSLLCT